MEKVETEILSNGPGRFCKVGQGGTEELFVVHMVKRAMRVGIETSVLRTVARLKCHVVNYSLVELTL